MKWLKFIENQPNLLELIQLEWYDFKNIMQSLSYITSIVNMLKYWKISSKTLGNKNYFTNVYDQISYWCCDNSVRMNIVTFTKW